MSNVSRETHDLLDQYVNLVTLWNPKINLVAPSTLVDFRNRHIEDCLQLTEIMETPNGHWVDIGSGGGLPGLVIAIAFRKAQLKLTLVESDKRKCEFLRTVIRELGLKNVSILPQRIESISPLNADYMSARALAALPKLLGYISWHLSSDGIAWLMKGRKWQEELVAAEETWQFKSEQFPSKTDSEAAILKISGVSHA
ncbi:16S rRNA (guanine(527)-N(7))-methyltransferase RsmG [Paracoccus sp. JM45]|uniref:16S rRNA (guanine(527)-N(7))-methyltransferase RsmG n=1 Tax=Paracoccus sp. JM45 TaxID=2283626 RepID=UPI000E6D083D|nr:16S rRNA (guanine(527)-N(7))-methyltransferase RsmG [Paracoccus sp. JM45]RJE80959.1 16S rRNA (guanine(527)-N(7))-methyltransferase RsmG [Paracoccus sp. JM45]